MSNFKIISSYHSTINLYTTSMGAESFVKPKKYIAGILDLAALSAVHSLGTRSAVDLKRYSNISEVYRSWLHSLGTRSAVEFLKVFTTN